MTFATLFISVSNSASADILLMTSTCSFILSSQKLCINLSALFHLKSFLSPQDLSQTPLRTPRRIALQPCPIPSSDLTVGIDARRLRLPNKALKNSPCSYTHSP